MKWAFLLAFAASLAGCGEDKGAVLARCDLEAMKLANAPRGRPNYISTCMRAAGYEAVGGPMCDFPGIWEFRETCYRSTAWWARVWERK